MGENYTGMTIGTRLSDVEKIERCPKCGRRGKARHNPLHAIYVHVSSNGEINPATGKLKSDACCVNKFNKENK